MADLTAMLANLGGIQGLVADPGASFAGGLAQGLQLQQAQAQAAAAQQEQQQAQQYQIDSQRVFANPSPKAVAFLMAKYPKAASGLKQGWDLLDEDAKTENLKTLSAIYSAGHGGYWDAAAKAARQRFEAEQKAGAADEADERILEMLESKDPKAQKAALGMVGYQLAAVVGPERFSSAFSAVGNDSRDAELQPVKVQKAQADAVTAQAEADAAPAYYGARNRKEVADASIAETEAAWRPEKLKADLAGDLARIAKLRTVIADRGKATGKPLGKVTVSDVMVPIYKKVSEGVPLTAGEQTAWVAYTRAPKAQREQYAPTVVGGPSRAAPASRPPAPGARTAPAAGRIIVNPKTGQRMQLRGGQWVPVR